MFGCLGHRGEVFDFIVFFCCGISRLQLTILENSEYMNTENCQEYAEVRIEFGNFAGAWKGAMNGAWGI